MLRSRRRLGDLGLHQAPNYTLLQDLLKVHPHVHLAGAQECKAGTWLRAGRHFYVVFTVSAPYPQPTNHWPDVLSRTLDRASKDAGKSRQLNHEEILSCKNIR